MPIISKFPVWSSPWKLTISEINSHQTFSPKDNFCCADSVLWDNKTGVLLNHGDGIQVMTAQELKTLRYLNLWVWLSGDQAAQTAYFAAVASGTIRQITVEYTKIATIVPR